ncbi:MAG TPA: hypothetical protein VLT36_03540 [Candidatus Dormibacteraeota bacterium]|nr:hypothetical protein [Candidatus Dormibacteraeota bacterium]
MKNLNLTLTLASAAAVFGLAGSALAQSQLTTADGLAASPQFRKQLEEQTPKVLVAPPEVIVVQPPTTPAPPPVVSGEPPPQPPYPQPVPRGGTIDDRNCVTGTYEATDQLPWTFARPTDGLAASPRFRKELQERGRLPVLEPLR